jgi:hypothetical protein
MEPADSLPLSLGSGSSPFHEAVEYDEEIRILLFTINFNNILSYIPKYAERSLAIIFSDSGFVYVRFYYSFVS